jgi:hypothetical protein
MVLATIAANMEALKELKSMFCRCIVKIKDKDNGSPSMSKATVENWAPINSSTTQPIWLKIFQPNSNNSVADSLGFCEAGHGVDFVNNWET